ncbi:hypothetical protein HDV03_003847 [Kappamyces sp. JEL0829]|nr:hypothetical protein HDV03_003847 [Kappamyces sp. JEL0829]
MTRKVVIDTDAGIDDAMAILLGLECDSCQVVALTACAGNTDLNDGIEQLKCLVALSQQPHIPIYAGCAGPIISDLFHEKATRWEGHCQDGLGGFTQSPAFPGFAKDFLGERHAIRVAKQHASCALIDIVNENHRNQTPVDILALGPLTNLAVAIQLDPTFLSKVNRLYIMGGALHGKGNVSRSGEFNFHYDPEAAHIVCHSSLLHSQARPNGPLVELITWEVTLRHGLAWDWIDQFQDCQPYGYFMHQITHMYRGLCRKTWTGTAANPLHDFDHHQELSGKLVLADVYAAFACFYPETVVSYKDWHTVVELQGVYARGSNFYHWFDNASTGVNARVVFSFDQSLMLEQLQQLLRSGSRTSGTNGLPNLPV